MIPKELDDTDRKIIKELKKNSRISMTELGKKVFMTGQAAKNRLERLQDLGVVERELPRVRLHRPWPLHPPTGKGPGC